MPDTIIIRGAREHNLKNIDLDLPRDQLIVITGLSGSGKSSLAFDTIYAEGQRRYVESQGRLPRAGDAGDHHQPVAGDLQVEVLEVVLAGAADGDGVHGVDPKMKREPGKFPTPAC